VIPIHKLTEADRKWMLTAPYGGSGGRPIVHGLCVEEPDIEIGAGVSSKAISRRMQTDKSGQHGPKSTKREEENGGGGGPGGKWRHKDKHRRSGGGPGGAEGGKAGNNNNDDSIVVDALPAGITMGPNGINYPPNFAFGAPAAASNP
jgi:protein NRD1